MNKRHYFYISNGGSTTRQIGVNARQALSAAKKRLTKDANGYGEGSSIAGIILDDFKKKKPIVFASKDAMIEKFPKTKGCYDNIRDEKLAPKVP